MKLLKLITQELLEKETIIAEEIEFIKKYEKRPPKREVKKSNDNTKTLESLISEAKTEDQNSDKKDDKTSSKNTKTKKTTDKK